MKHRSDRSCRRAVPIGSWAIMLVLATLCFEIVPAATLEQSLGQSALLAAFSVACVSFSRAFESRESMESAESVGVPQRLARVGNVSSGANAGNVGNAGKAGGRTAPSSVPNAPAALNASSAVPASSVVPVMSDASDVPDMPAASDESAPSDESVPSAGNVPSVESTAFAASEALSSSEQLRFFHLRDMPKSWMVCLLAAALAGAVPVCASALFASPASPASSVASMRIAEALLLCLFTGVFEEGAFRVLAIDALEALAGRPRDPQRLACCVAAGLFALAHVSLGDVASAAAEVGGTMAVCLWVHALLKFAQAVLFGIVMGAIYLRLLLRGRARRLLPVALAHAAFDVLYLGPGMVLAGTVQPYVTGNPLDIVFLALSVAFLVPAAISSFRVLAS